MSGFDATWLALREPFDVKARSPLLQKAFSRQLKWRAGTRAAPLRLLDLGGGTAANFRALAPGLSAHQHWVLCDHDPQLLSSVGPSVQAWCQDHGWTCQQDADGVEVEAGQWRWRLQTRCIDLAHDLKSIDATGFDGVTTTAFLDLVSMGWLQRLVDWLDKASVPLWATLTVDGRRHWSPALPQDELIAQAFEAHQATDKGFGASIGGGAAQVLQGLWTLRGTWCECQASDWHIGAEHNVMLERLCSESASVALQVYPRQAEQIHTWLTRRRAQIASHQASLSVGHLDLLALPGTAQPHSQPIG
jgi:hypothetical protein